MKNIINLPAVTLLGQAGSGKTNLLAALLNHAPSWLDMEEGAQAIENAGFRAIFESGGEDERAFDYLSTHFVSMLKGKENLLEATNAARSYGVSLSFDEPAPEPSPKGSWLSLPKLRARTRTKPSTHSFRIVDGRGADAAPSEMISSDDKDSTTRRAAYRDGMDDSTGFVLFMPLMSDDEGSEAIISQRFLNELNDAIERKRARGAKHPKLDYISLCFTKCERAFLRDGVYAIEEARSRESYEELLADNAVLSTFRGILTESLREDTFEMRIFPVSTYGFVHNSGAPNFYPWEEAPGLLTRAVSQYDDYDDGDIGNYKDHFPFPVTDDQAKSMWRPFNIAPPLLYALTGRVTGPLSFSTRDALDFIAN